MEDIKKEMISHDKECRVISIVGSGGTGKTTIARKIYHQVESEFESSAMVYVSEVLTTRDILLDIAKQVGLSESQMKHKMQENLSAFLYNRKYVIFLDDILPDKWDVLKDIVVTPDSTKRRRIIFTCRDRGVCKSHKEFHLDRLSQSEGEKLFYERREEPLSPELRKIGDEIVEKCCGWPLAIHVAAGMLNAKEASESSWNEVLQRVNEVGQNDRLINMILDLSYQDLPTKLKPFFLYFGIFPMNREFFVSELTQLWVAEKLVIQAGEYRKPNKIVEDYIDELIKRNLIQVYRRKSDGRVKSSGIQNVLHVFCTKKAKEINFFCNWNNLRNADLASTARRVVTNSSSSSSDQNNFEDDFTVPRSLRALLCFGKGRELAKFIKSYASELKFLQLLTIDVGHIAINLPIEIADLSGLIYLKLIGQFITVPPSIGRMKKLETLEVRSRDVPEIVLKMKHLKHLFVTGVKVGKPKIRNQEQVDLQNLETLDFNYEYGYHLTSSSFKKVPNLKTLKIYGAVKQTLDDLTSNKPLLQKLEDLKLQVDSISESDIPSLVWDFSHYNNLRKLQLFFDRSVTTTCLLEFPKTLGEITLRGISMEEEDPLEKLQKLPSLKIINLQNCKARKMDFSGKNKFPELEILILYDTEFSEITVDERVPPQKLDQFIYKAHAEQESKVPRELKKYMVEMEEADYLA